MKMKNTILRTLIVIMVAILGIGIVLPSLAFTNENKVLTLSYFRYVNGNYTNGYGLNTVGNEGESHHPIFQIVSSTNDTNYYCLNATAGESWLRGTVGAEAKYNIGYDLNSSSDINQLKTDTNDVYKNIGNSSHLNHILWILDNMYIPDKKLSAEQNLAKKRELLAKAGIIYDNVIETVKMQEVKTDNMTYKYVPQTGYDFNDQLFNIKDGHNNSIYGTQETYQGWYYYDTESKFNNVELTDDIIEVAQQAAIWYFTNYLENNTENSETYNVRTQGLNLVCSNGTTETNSHNWKPLEDDTFSVETNMWDQANNKRKKAEVGKWKQEMATILCWYLIDAANNNASSATPTSQGVPVTIAPETANLSEKTVNNTNYYVVGPIKIDETRVVVNPLNNSISVNGDTSTGAYISNAEGKKDSNQNLSNHIGQNFYIAIPKSKVNGNNITITFDGSYKTNEKKLLVATTKTEQPVVEVTPNEKTFELIVNAPIQKEFDLALRKAITKITSADGKTKNEKGANAERKVTVDTTTIPNTATYKHRKDPVVVEKGDIVTYSITIYNEGEMNGYAKTIVDKLPQGLALKGYTANKTTTGTYKSGNINYSYVYDNTNNTITFTNVSKNTLAAYAGQNNLASETIQIECEVTQEPSSSTNTYLTNIAYISGAHNTETNQDVVQDRDSRTDRNPSANQNTTGDKYTGYHGGNNNNGDNTKNVYNDGTNNDDYFPGREDDDDFEIIVLKPAVFDLALQKYIENIIPEDLAFDDTIFDDTTKGRNAPTIDTTKLANGTATTATYTQDKTPIKVKSGDYVLYNFTVYNEGQIDGYVKKITDNIPTGLEFVYAKTPKDGKTVITCDSQGNMKEIEVSSGIYQWVEMNSLWSIDTANDKLKKDSYNGEETVSITCDVSNWDADDISMGKPGFLKAYDSSKDNNNDGSGLDRFSVQVLLRVSAPNGAGITIRNEAAITEATDKDGNIQDVTDLKDRDSQTNQWPGKDGDKNYQDDEDFDNIILGKVDLALTKFIIAVGDKYPFKDGDYLTQDGTNKNAGSATNPYTRQTAVDTTPLKNGGHDAKYTQVKTSLVIPENSYVLYNIRVYNEGEVDVFAGEVKDYLPNYLDFVEGEFNNSYGWKVASDGKTVTTNLLSKANGTDKMLKAFDKQGDNGKGSKLDYKDLPILCRINTKTPDKTKLVNSSEITKYEDEDGNEIDKDIDSEPDNLPEDKKNKEGKPEGRYDQDDEDYEVVEIRKKIVDLALTKFITAISEDEKIENGEYLTPNQNIGSTSNPYTRQTAVDTTPLKNGGHDAIYTQVKTPLTIPEKSYVLYNIRVYNEGEVDVYAGEVRDYLPNYLDFVEGEFNTSYGWKISSDGKTVTTSLLSKANGTDKMLKAFDKQTDDGKGSKLDYKDLPILCRVNTSAPNKTKLINSAEITKYEDKDGNEIEKDVDSEPDNLSEKNKEKREQDDDDFEVVEIRKKTVDLALSKFIAAISSDTDISDGEYLTASGNVGSKDNPYTRATEVDTIKLRDDENCHDATYTKVKDPLTVPAQSYVLYDIRVYNEGETDVYAGEVTDHLPEYLDYVDCEFNKNFGWSVASDGKTISTTYLSYAKGEKNLLKAFDKKIDDGKGSGLDYRDLQVLCRVNKNAPTNTNIVNVAEITRYENKNGDPIPEEDIDSRPNNVNEKNEDDDDYEVILIKTFDLSLLKYVSEVYVTEDGKTTTTKTGNTGDNSKDIIPKVEINKKKLNSTVVKFGYTIKITNEGDIEGYAKEITDYVPEGLKFYAEDNNGWKDEGNNVISTRLLENTLLKPGESAEVKVIFRWINGSNNLGLKTNVAEISEDYNKEGVPDRDSTPDNRKEGEDDIDDAKVILSIKTGLVYNIVMYASAGLIILIVLGMGISIIKKYVL